MNVLTLPSQPLSAQISAIEQGLPSRTLTDLAEVMGLSKARLIAGLQLVQRTTTLREKKRQRFTPAESERLFRLVRVRSLARKVFATDAAAAEWINTPDRSLGNKTPLELLATDLGSQKVENLVRAMTHGVPV